MLEPLTVEFVSDARSVSGQGLWIPAFAGYVLSLGTDFTDVAVGHGLEACHTRGRDARDTVVCYPAKHVLCRNDKQQDER